MKGNGKMKWGFLLLSLLIFGGCSVVGSIESVEKEDGTKQIVRVIPQKDPPIIEDASQGTEGFPDNKTWISPGKVQVSNFEPGNRAEWVLTIHNGSCDSREFSVSYKVPPKLQGDYLEGVKRASDWVYIEDTSFIMAPKETREVLVALEMPEDAEVFSSNWEFWVAVKPTSSAFIQTELATRWLIWMK